MAMGLTPADVLPALRGSYGREYHYARETETTQRMLPADAEHGAVLGRLGSHVLRRALSPGAGGPMA